MAHILAMASMCETFHQLPRAGGLLDQDCLILPAVMEAMQLRNQKAAEDAERAAAARARTVQQKRR